MLVCVSAGPVIIAPDAHDVCFWSNSLVKVSTPKMNWIKQQWVPPTYLSDGLYIWNADGVDLTRVANVAGTQEPIYGPSALQSVARQANTTPYTELQKSDLRWVAMDSTCVETQTFYMMAESGHIGMAQVIYSNVA